MKHRDEKFEEKLTKNISVFDRLSLTPDKLKEIAEKAASGAEASGQKPRVKTIPFYRRAKFGRYLAAAASFTVVLAAFAYAFLFRPNAFGLGEHGKSFDFETNLPGAGQLNDQSPGQAVAIGGITPRVFAINDNLACAFENEHCGMTLPNAAPFITPPICRAQVRVTAGDSPVLNVPVTGLDAAGNVVANALTDINGFAYLYTGLFGEGAAPIVYAKSFGNVSPLTGGKTVIDVANGPQKQINADILFIFENPRSNSEKAAVIKANLGKITAGIAAQTGANVRLALNSNVGGSQDPPGQNSRGSNPDDSISPSHDPQDGWFSDLPGLFYTGVYKNEWREDAVRLCVLVPEDFPGDAAHIWKDISDTVKTAQAGGIRFIPVLTRGRDDGLSFYRTLAAATGGTAVVVVNETGKAAGGIVSGALKPETLDTLLIRVLSFYLTPQP